MVSQGSILCSSACGPPTRLTPAADRAARPGLPDPARPVGVGERRKTLCREDPFPWGELAPSLRPSAVQPVLPLPGEGGVLGPAFHPGGPAAAHTAAPGEGPRGLQSGPHTGWEPSARGTGFDPPWGPRRAAGWRGLGRWSPGENIFGVTVEPSPASADGRPHVPPTVDRGWGRRGQTPSSGAASCPAPAVLGNCGHAPLLLPGGAASSVTPQGGCWPLATPRESASPPLARTHLSTTQRVWIAPHLTPLETP